MSIRSEFVKTDATNRALRSVIQGLAIDVGVGIVLAIGVAFASAGGWGDMQWIILSFSVAKSAVQAVVAYVMRCFVDQSAIPTPLPPAVSGA